MGGEVAVVKRAYSQIGTNCCGLLFKEHIISSTLLHYSRSVAMPVMSEVEKQFWWNIQMRLHGIFRKAQRQDVEDALAHAREQWLIEPKAADIERRGKREDWTIVVAGNAVKNMLGYGKRFISIEALLLEPIYEESAAQRAEATIDMMSLLKMLEQHEEELVMQHTIFDIPFSELATTLGEKVETIRKRYTRAMGKLREEAKREMLREQGISAPPPRRQKASPNEAQK